MLSSRRAPLLPMLCVLAAAALLADGARAGFGDAITLRSTTPQAYSYFGFAVTGGDFDGDGYDEVAVAAPYASVDGLANAGEVNVFAAPTLAAGPTLRQPVPESGARFGWALAAGDMDGDTLDDVIAGAPYADVGATDGAGRVFIMRGPDFSAVTAIDNPSPETNARFGGALATGDVNNDSHLDLVVGAPETPVSGLTRAGKTFVFLGPGFTSYYSLQDPQPEAQAYFGRAVATGDLEGDGDDDVIVGAPDSDVAGGFVDAGQAFVFVAPALGAPSLLQDPEPMSGAFFGRAVTSGDFDGDGDDDVMVGAYGSDVLPHACAGQVFVFAAPSLQFSKMLQEVVPELDAYFGFALTTGDVNNDGYADAVIGVHDADSGGLAATSGGEAYIYLGPALDEFIFFEDPQPERFAFFARAIALADVSGDGQDDFIAGAPWSDVGTSLDAGEAFVFLAEPDADGDTVSDDEDNCPLVFNPDQANTLLGRIDNGPVVPGDDVTNPYEDRVGDACDDDADNDLLPDADEAAHSTNPALRDSDGDRVIDGAEVLLGSDPLDAGSRPSCSLPSDADRDCLPAAVEAILGSSDSLKDSDGDGIGDGIEVRGWGTSPTLPDSDGDGCDDDKEIADVNGDAMANGLDYVRVLQRVFAVQDDDPADGDPVPDPYPQVSPAFDLNKDGMMNSLDAVIAALNSSLVEPPSACDCR
ncbi:MAG: FG-GAP-like repeat-containing protein [Dehalococcoidia bacterium]|nr:FG-GAP-like repeat-containing protein [Dehalococcoidia bacterium]